MSSTTGTTPSEGKISMRLIRSIGNLQTRPHLNFFQRFFSAKGPSPVDLKGNLIQSSLVMQPVLSGKVIHLDVKRIAHEQLAKVKQLLAENVNVAELASPFYGYIIDYGVMSRRTVTDNGVTALAGGFAGAFTISNFKFHAFGTGTTAEAEAHANLVTELTTQYATDSTRPTGTQANTASAGSPPQSATYVTVGTLSPDSGGTIAITEHGLFAAATGVGGGANTMWDRSVFSAVNLVAGADSLQVTYTLTLTANG